MQDWMSCLYAFFGCGAFCFIFEMRRWRFILTAAGIGLMAQVSYLLLSEFSTVSQLLLATIVTATLAEIFARVLKTPATVFLIVGIIPLVPGGGLYYTMESLVNGDMQMFTQYGMETVASAGAIAVGSSLVSAVTRIIAVRRAARRQRRQRELEEQEQQE